MGLRAFVLEFADGSRRGAVQNTGHKLQPLEDIGVSGTQAARFCGGT